VRACVCLYPHTHILYVYICLLQNTGAYKTQVHTKHRCIQNTGAYKTQVHTNTGTYKTQVHISRAPGPYCDWIFYGGAFVNPSMEMAACHSSGPKILRWFKYFWKNLFYPAINFCVILSLNYLHALHSTTTYNAVNLLNTIYSQFAYVQLQAGIRTSRDISMLIGFATSEVRLFF